MHHNPSSRGFMPKEEYSILELLFPQLVRSNLYLNIGSNNIHDNCWDTFEHFPTFSTAFSNLLIEEIGRYANEISTETNKSKRTENSSLFCTVDALTNEPATEEEYESFDFHIKELAHNKVDIAIENQIDVDLSIVRKYAKLLVEIDDYLTSNVRSITLEQTIPRLTLITNILKSNRIVDPELFKQNYHKAIDYLRKVAARYHIVRIPEGYRKIETTNIGEKFSLPDYFEILDENRKIPIFDNDTKILNPKLFERKIIRLN